jgi:hypothetical protein
VEDQVKPEHLAAIRQCADRFHEILSAVSVERMLGDPKTTRRAYELLRDKKRRPEQIERIAADGFEALVMVLRDLGETDVTIHECNPSEHEQ